VLTLQYITEKDGVIVDRRVEKRQTRVTTVEKGEEDFDQVDRPICVISHSIDHFLGLWFDSEKSFNKDIFKVAHDQDLRPSYWY